MIREFKEEDAIEVSALIARTLRETNIRDYSEDYIENDVKILCSCANTYNSNLASHSNEIFITLKR